MIRTRRPSVAISAASIRSAVVDTSASCSRMAALRAARSSGSSLAFSVARKRFARRSSTASGSLRVTKTDARLLTQGPQALSFGQAHWPIEIEARRDARHARSRLSGADADPVGSREHPALALERHHAQVARTELELDCACFAGLERNPLKAPQREMWRARVVWKIEVKLRNLIARNRSDIADLGLDLNAPRGAGSG